MGVKVRCMRQALNTSIGTQNFTISGLGPAEEIKAAIFLVTAAVTDATQTTHQVVSYGLTDGTDQRAVGCCSEDGVIGSDTKRVAATDEVIMMIDPTSGGAGSIDMEANIVSFITDGVQINIGNAGPAFLCTVIFFVGTSVLAKAGHVVYPGGSPAVDVTTPLPFPAEMLVSITNGVALFDQSPEVDAFPGIGWWTAPLQDFSYCSVDEDGQSTTDADFTQNNGLSGIQSTGTSTITVPSINIQEVTDSGFKVRRGANSISADVTFAFLALSFDGVVGVDSSRTADPPSTGDYDVEIGFTAQFVAQLIGEITNMGCGYGLGVFDATNEFCISFDSEDGVTTTVAKSRADSKAAMVVDAGGTTRYEGTFSSFLATEYRVNYSTVTSGKDILSLAIEEEPTLQWEQENFRWRDDDGSESAATFLAAEEVNITRAKSTNTRLRTTMDSIGADPPTVTRTLQYIQKGDNPSEWRDVPLT